MIAARLRLGLLGDLHLANEPHPRASWHNDYDFAGVPARVRAALDAFHAAHVDAICLIGDLTHHGNADALATLAKALAWVEPPAIVVAGNHDAGKRALAQALPSAHLASPEGELLAGFRIAGVQVAEGPWFGARAEDAPAIPAAWGQEPVVLLSHFPLLAHAARLAERGMPYPGDLIGRPQIAEALDRRAGPTTVLSGHVHARDSSYRRAVLQIVQAALVEAPYECSVVEVTATTVTRRAIELRGPAAENTPPVVAPAHEHFDLVNGTWRSGAPLMHIIDPALAHAW